MELAATAAHETEDMLRLEAEMEEILSAEREAMAIRQREMDEAFTGAGYCGACARPEKEEAAHGHASHSPHCMHRANLSPPRTACTRMLTRLSFFV